MAKRDGGSPPTPGENEFAPGYPPHIFSVSPGERYLCCNCRHVLKKAQQTPCGHRYCSACLSWIVRTKPICAKCKEEPADPDVVPEDSLRTIEQAFGDAATDKEISELKVHCVAPGCRWKGVLKEYDDHQNLCDYAPILCHMGCGRTIMRRELADHLEKDCRINASPNEEPGKHSSSKQSSGTWEGEDTMEFHEDFWKLSCRTLELENKVKVFENIIAVLNKELDNSLLQLTSAQEQRAKDQSKLNEFEQKLIGLQASVTIKDKTINELNMRVETLEKTSYDGDFLWKITNLKQRFQDAISGRTNSLYSPAFYSSRYGYKVCLRIYLNGDGAGKGTHVSLFFTIMRGEYDNLLPWPFKNKVTFMLLDQSNREPIIDAFRPDITSASFQRPVTDMNIASGCPLFCQLPKLQSPRNHYVKDDAMFIRCIIDSSS
ncbi:TNF receptor-associated factor 1 [Spea bombifrons]|uniref:TNF receptor-associated factor 1 n=1 Tax=Spea bombifrons TaxID=233779 RepID=UPI00234B17D1|nr:TNF receptor-associated factor 1 [Spea bombifrons]